MFLDVGDVQINLSNAWLQGFINLAHGMIMDTVKSKIPGIVSAIQGKFETFNALLKNHTDTTFLLGLIDPQFPINMTLTHAPIIDAPNNLVTLYFDGRIFDTPENMTHGKLPTVAPSRVTDANGNSQQLFVHQSMLASLFFALDQQFLPLEINNANVTKQLGGFF